MKDTIIRIIKANPKRKWYCGNLSQEINRSPARTNKLLTELVSEGKLMVCVWNRSYLAK